MRPATVVLPLATTRQRRRLLDPCDVFRLTLWPRDVQTAFMLQRSRMPEALLVGIEAVCNAMSGEVRFTNENEARECVVAPVCGSNL